MKKTFDLEHPKIKVARMVDSVKHEIKKYVKKERKSLLPEGATYWAFDCQLGPSEAVAVDVPLLTLSAQIDELVANNMMTIYINITPKAMTTSKSPYSQEK